MRPQERASNAHCRDLSVLFVAKPSKYEVVSSSLVDVVHPTPSPIFFSLKWCQPVPFSLFEEWKIEKKKVSEITSVSSFLVHSTSASKRDQSWCHTCDELFPIVQYFYSDLPQKSFNIFLQQSRYSNLINSPLSCQGFSNWYAEGG